MQSLNDLAMTLRYLGHLDEALDVHRSALCLAESMGDGYEHARALDGMAPAYLARGEPDLAGTTWEEALRRYAGLGVPEANQGQLQSMARP